MRVLKQRMLNNLGNGYAKINKTIKAFMFSVCLVIIVIIVLFFIV